MKIARILVATDFSAAGYRAVQSAADSVRREKGGSASCMSSRRGDSCTTLVSSRDMESVLRVGGREECEHARAQDQAGAGVS